MHDLALKRAEILAAKQKPADEAAALAALTLHGMPIEDLSLDFTLPGEPSVELCAGGSDKAVTLDNVGEYVQRVVDVSLGEGVRAQLDAFTKGFSGVVGADKLRAFSPDEIDTLFNGSQDKWEVEAVAEALKPDHGFTRSSAAFTSLVEIICAFDTPTRRQFLKFVTGSPRLPVGGLARLSPRLTVVLKRPEAGISPDTYLPSVMTCANYLKLPDYSSKAVMRGRILTAINEGQGAFLLS